MRRKPRATPSKSCPAPTAAAKWAKPPASTPRKNSAPATSSPPTKPTTSASFPILDLASMLQRSISLRLFLRRLALLVIERLCSWRQADPPRSRSGVESASRGNNDEHFSDSPCSSLHLHDWLSLLQRLHRCQGARP